jgi:hypothetical protein
MILHALKFFFISIVIFLLLSIVFVYIVGFTPLVQYGYDNKLIPVISVLIVIYITVAFAARVVYKKNPVPRAVLSKTIALHLLFPLLLIVLDVIYVGMIVLESLVANVFIALLIIYFLRKYSR